MKKKYECKWTLGVKLITPPESCRVVCLFLYMLIYYSSEKCPGKKLELQKFELLFRYADNNS